MDEERDVLSKVALLDPAPAVRARLADILASAGAREIVEERAPEGWTLAFVEVETPDDLARFQAVQAQDPLAPVVVLATDPGSPLARQAVRGGAFAILPKPIRSEDTLRLVDEVRRETEPLVRIVPHDVK